MGVKPLSGQSDPAAELGRDRNVWRRHPQHLWLHVVVDAADLEVVRIDRRPVPPLAHPAAG